MTRSSGTTATAATRSTTVAPGFDRVEVNGSATGGRRCSSSTADASGATFQRTNLVPFTLEIDPDNEVVAVNGGGGNDTFTRGTGRAGLLVAADGGAGNDELSGANEADSFFGGSGNDMLTGGGGSDLLDGSEGDDRLFARDGAGDLVRGGTGADSAQTDQVTVDAIDGVETLEATPAPVPDPGPQPGGVTRRRCCPTVGRVAVVRSHGKLIARAPVSCPAAEAGGCRTALTLETAKAVRLGKVRAVLVLGSATVDLAPGQTRPSRSGSTAAPPASPGTAGSRPGSRSRAPTPPATRRRDRWPSACESPPLGRAPTPRRRPARGLLYRAEPPVEHGNR